MNFSPTEVLNFVKENDVKFIRLTFCDAFGNMKNVAIMPDELPRAFECGIPLDSSYITDEYADLLLFPDISTLSVLPWRPKSGRVVRFFCNIKNIDGSDYSGDLRRQLQNKIKELNEEGYLCEFATKCEFYLFDLDENGNPTYKPHDNGSYLDVSPLDKCENTRREICLSLEEMGFNPKSSCHKHGAGQNEIDFKRSEPVTAADNMVHYKTVVKSIAAQNGLYASFMPKPLDDEDGSALNICLSIKKNGKDIFGFDNESMTDEGEYFIAGILNRIKEMTAFFNPISNSYERLNSTKYAPRYINWSFENFAPLVKVSRYTGLSPCIEIRSADAACNPYIVFNLILSAGFEGIKNKTELRQEYFIKERCQSEFEKLPVNLGEAYDIASESEFIKKSMNENTRVYLLNTIENLISHYKYKNGDIYEVKVCALEENERNFPVI